MLNAVFLVIETASMVAFLFWAGACLVAGMSLWFPLFMLGAGHVPMLVRRLDEWKSSSP